jgi:hypothetical protein
LPAAQSWSDAQAVQPPQWAGSVCSFAHAFGPSAPREQLVNPALHAVVHAPFWQESPPSTEQALPHALQLFPSLVRFTHLPLQFVRPGGHAVAQAPVVHV